ncbi:hypothetical protein K432DRAFT_406836 [Lepidopterella palustris CBS 459.81]|uniref:DUF7719 domain-containing protein n=1 Tax=Lepidopterella palustris CBS 459.81 TaxID=1314670 RepID=A0A8E2E6C1_9PEZI|nr:hypothetical protein K432DRAFT_406836 [Lepidopterella palustris CBS 459.81]
MAETNKATNRKQRRAAAHKDLKSNGSSFKSTTEIDDAGVEYLLKHPDRSGPKGKTLLQLAEERQAELNKGKPAGWNIGGNTPEGEVPFNDDPIGPFGNAILYSISLSMLHFTLDVIVYSQYREDVIWNEIFKRTGTVLPIFFVLVYLLHVPVSFRFPILRNLFFLATSIIAGCYMVYSGNINGYFFVMKTAPPIGTLWVWSVVEMSLPYALASVLSVGGYLWWNGFEIF